MGLPGMNVPWEAPFGYRWLCLQVQLGLFSLAATYIWFLLVGVSGSVIDSKPSAIKGEIYTRLKFTLSFKLSKFIISKKLLGSLQKSSINALIKSFLMGFLDGSCRWVTSTPHSRVALPRSALTL